MTRARAHEQGEAVAARRYTLAGLAWCTVVAGIVVAFNGHLTLTSLIGLGPVITAAYGGRLRTLAVAVYAVAMAVLVGLSAPVVNKDEWTRVGIVAICGVVALWLATLRVRRQSLLKAALEGEARERRRRQNAEADERLYRLAGALAAAVTPDQVAETAFEAVRAEFDASAGILSVLTGRGTLRSSWSFGYRPGVLERWGRSRSTRPTRSPRSSWTGSPASSNRWTSSPSTGRSSPTPSWPATSSRWPCCPWWSPIGPSGHWPSAGPNPACSTTRRRASSRPWPVRPARPSSGPASP